MGGLRFHDRFIIEAAVRVLSWTCFFCRELLSVGLIQVHVSPHHSAQVLRTSQQPFSR